MAVSDDRPFAQEAELCEKPPAVTQSRSKRMSAVARRQRQRAPLRHGGYLRSRDGKRLQSLRVQRLAERMASGMPWITDADWPALLAYCQLELVGWMLFRDIEERGVSAKGSGDEPRRLLGELRATRAAQLRYAAELGLTPAARASLGLTVASGEHANVATQLASLRLARAQGGDSE